jgi:hypothetical protein
MGLSCCFACLREPHLNWHWFWLTAPLQQYEEEEEEEEGICVPRELHFPFVTFVEILLDPCQDQERTLHMTKNIYILPQCVLLQPFS